MSKVKDTNYLAITAMLAARETKMLSAERMERMIDAFLAFARGDATEQPTATDPQQRAQPH